MKFNIYNKNGVSQINQQYSTISLVSKTALSDVALKSDRKYIQPWTDETVGDVLLYKMYRSTQTIKSVAIGPISALHRSVIVDSGGGTSLEFYCASEAKLRSLNVYSFDPCASVGTKYGLVIRDGNGNLNFDSNLIPIKPIKFVTQSLNLNEIDADNSALLFANCLSTSLRIGTMLMGDIMNDMYANFTVHWWFEIVNNVLSIKRIFGTYTRPADVPPDENGRGGIKYYTNINNLSMIGESGTAKEEYIPFLVIDTKL